MQEIQSNLLWLGNASDARNPKQLHEFDIAAVVDLAAEEPSVQLPREFIYCRFPLLDGDGNLPSTLLHCVQTIVDFLHSETRTLVACSAGMSRSPLISAFALAVHLNLLPEEMVKKISKQRKIELNESLWKDVSAICSSVRKH